MTSSGYGTGTDNTGSSWPGSEQESFNRTPPSSSGYDNSLLRRQQQSTDKHGDFTDINKESTEYSMIDESKVKVIKRPLPQVPRQSSETEAIRKPRRRKCTIVVMIVSVLVLLAAGAAVYLWHTCKWEVFCKGETNIQKPHPSGPCYQGKNITANTNDTFECVVAIMNPTAMLLTQPNGKPLKMLITNGVINTTNLIESKLTVSVNQTDIGLNVLVTMKEVDCSLNGIYTVTITNDTNHNTTYELTVNVKPEAGTSFCPCDVSRYLGLDGKIKCEVVNVLEDKQASLTIRKSKSGVTLIRDVAIQDLVSEKRTATSVNGTTLTVTKNDDGDGVLVTLQMAQLTCSDGDVFIFEIGNSTYTTTFHVESEQRLPVITTEHDYQGGLAILPLDKYAQEIECEAKTGCFDATPKLYYRYQDSLKFEEITKSINMTRDEPNYEGLGKGFRLKLIIHDLVLEQDTHGKQFQCSYRNEIGEKMESKVFTAMVLPENVCSEDETTNLCNIPHPYVCEKFVTCGGRPRQRSCPNGSQWFQMASKDPCTGGRCEDANVVGCTTDF